MTLRRFAWMDLIFVALLGASGCSSNGGETAVIGSGGGSGSGGNSSGAGGREFGAGGSFSGFGGRDYGAGGFLFSGGFAAGGFAGSSGAGANGGSAGSGGIGGANSSPCPDVAPQAESSCTQENLSCFYEDCAGSGRTAATCTSGSWSLATSACSSFSCTSETCAPGQVCSITTGGTQFGMCIDNPCGSGPITCECVAPNCGAGQCTVNPFSGGVQVTCNTCNLCP
jgi:hypothetical protein